MITILICPTPHPIRRVRVFLHRNLDGKILNKLYVNVSSNSVQSRVYLKAWLYERTPLRVAVSLRGRGREVSIEQARVPLGGRLWQEIQPRPPSRLPEGQPCRKLTYRVILNSCRKVVLSHLRVFWCPGWRSVTWHPWRFVWVLTRRAVLTPQSATSGRMGGGKWD